MTILLKIGYFKSELTLLSMLAVESYIIKLATIE